MSLDISPLVSWANEREAIRLRKLIIQRSPTHLMLEGAAEERAWGLNNGPKFWTLDHLTLDPILQQYRFCNVQREHDRVTVWIDENIRKPFADHPHLWFMLAAARYINWPPTLAYLIDNGGWPNREGFNPEDMSQLLQIWKQEGNKVETGAYMIRAESDKNAPWYNWSKQRYVAEVVLGKLWEVRDAWRARFEDPAMSLQSAWEAFQQKHYTGWGPFMAYQVVVDLRWTRYLRHADDIQTWAAVGPGSRRGLNRLAGRPVDFNLKQDDALAEMREIREQLKVPGVLAPWVALPDLSDIQNCLCETDKYMRVQKGEGRPRSMYVPGRGY